MSPEVARHTNLKHDLSPDVRLASEVVANAALQFSDVQERQSQISEQLDYIVARHDVSGALQDPAQALMLVGLAAKLATAHAQDNDMYTQQCEFTDIAVGLLTGSIDPYPDEMDDDIKFDIYMDYENAALTRELDNRIKDGLLDEVKERMGITSENETPYVVHVLDIASYTSTWGIGPSLDELDNEEDLSVLYQAQKALDACNELIYDYKKGLRSKRRELEERLESKESIPEGWVQYRDGIPHLFMLNPNVEKILNPEVTNNAPYYDERARCEDVALIEHEYIHTQAPLLVGSIAFGGGIEELRAEHFSGNLRGYEEVKDFFRELNALSKVDVPAIFDAKPCGGTAVDVFAHIAQKVGVESAIDIFMAAPKNYCNRGIMKLVNDNLGGYGSVIQSILLRKVEAGERDAFESYGRRVLSWGGLAEIMSQKEYCTLEGNMSQ